VSSTGQFSGSGTLASPSSQATAVPPATLASHASELIAEDVSAWFSGRLVLERVHLAMARSKVTALIGPSGCGKSTFLRILNRMHEVVPGAELGGRVLLEGADIYGPQMRATEVRKHIGMVFQKPNPFPAMTIEHNVLAGLRFAGTKVRSNERKDLVQEMLVKAGLWNEVRNRLGALGGELSGGQLHRPGAGGAAERSLDGRALLGPRPHLDASHRRDHPRDRRRRHRRHRHPQHAAGPAGLALLCLLPGGREPARAHRRVGHDRADLREPQR
jgi:ABC-type Fe3+/spermidine/putrescine transport system ATPase subunit